MVALEEHGFGTHASGSAPCAQRMSTRFCLHMHVLTAVHCFVSLEQHMLCLVVTATDRGVETVTQLSLVNKHSPWSIADCRLAQCHLAA
jgi:hypothetical protein